MFEGTFFNFSSRREAAIWSYPRILIDRDFLHIENRDIVHIKGIEEDDEIRHLGMSFNSPGATYSNIHEYEM